MYGIPGEAPGEIDNSDSYYLHSKDVPRVVREGGGVTFQADVMAQWLPNIFGFVDTSRPMSGQLRQSMSAGRFLVGTITWGGS